MAALVKYVNSEEEAGKSDTATPSNGNVNFGFEGSTNELYPESNQCELYLSRRNSIAVAEKNADALLSFEDKLKEKRSIKKNLVLLYLSSILVSSPMYALINSASSLLSYSGVGVQSLAVLGATQLFGAAIVGSYSTKVWGVRKIVTISYLLTLLYILSFYYPILETSIVGGAFMGLGYTLLTVCLFMYGNILGIWYAVVASGNLDAVLVLMSGIINSSLGGGLMIGNILYYYVLDPGSQMAIIGNVTDEMYEVCGANYCNEDHSRMTTMKPPESWRYFTLMAIFTAMAIVAVFLSLFIQDFSGKLGFPVRQKSDFFVMLKETWLLLKDPRGYLLIVITTFIGIEEAFVFSEFTQAYVSCVIGIPKVGLVMLGLGLTELIVSLLVWIVVKYSGRIPLVVVTIIMFLGCFITLLSWSPRPHQAIVFYVISVLWGFADATLISVIFSFYGLLFEDNIEGSFAVGNFWFALGYLLSFGWGPFLCIYVKLYILIGFTVVGTLCYFILEVLIRKDDTLDLRAMIAAELTATLPITLPPNFGSNPNAK